MAARSRHECDGGNCTAVRLEKPRHDFSMQHAPAGERKNPLAVQDHSTALQGAFNTLAPLVGRACFRTAGDHRPDYASAFALLHSFCQRLAGLALEIDPCRVLASKWTRPAATEISSAADCSRASAM